MRASVHRKGGVRSCSPVRSGLFLVVEKRVGGKDMRAQLADRIG